MSFILQMSFILEYIAVLYSKKPLSCEKILERSKIIANLLRLYGGIDWKLKKKRGIITFEEMQKKYDEMKYDYILKDAKEKRIIWKGDGKDTRWKFRNSENKIVARKEEKDIDEAYLEFYCSTSEKKQIITFELLKSE